MRLRGLGKLTPALLSVLVAIPAGLLSFPATVSADALAVVQAVASEPSGNAAGQVRRTRAGERRRTLRSSAHRAAPASARRARVLRLARARAAVQRLRLTAAQRGSGRIQVLDVGAGPPAADPALPAIVSKTGLSAR